MIELGTNPGAKKLPGDGQPLSRFRVSYRKRDLAEFTLHVPGVHNILNATAAIAVGVGLDVAVDAIRAGLDQFRGVDRRFQLRGRGAGGGGIDDYWPPPPQIKPPPAPPPHCRFLQDPFLFHPPPSPPS